MTYSPYFGYSWGSFGTVLDQWNQIGVFTILLPFLLFFVLIFGILQKINLFKDNKVVNIVVALVVSLLAIGNDHVSKFLIPFFSNLAIGIVILVGAVILVGVFFDTEDEAFKKWIKYGAILGLIVFFVVLGNTPLFQGFGWQRFWSFLQQNGPLFTFLIVIFVVILVTALTGKGSRKKEIKIPQ